MAFDQATRNRLQKFVGDARKLLTEEFTRQLQNIYGLDPITGAIAELSDLPSLSPGEQQTANMLRDTLDHYLAASHTVNPYENSALVTAALDRIVREQAFTVLNRLAALRMAEARQFVMESISQGYQSKGFQLYQRIAGSALGETGQAYQVYLFSVFDELSLDLAVLFDRYASQGRLFPRETVLLELLDLINHAELDLLWAEDETVGWIYQYFNSKEERKKMRDESQAPRNSRELAVRNQFFTPRYVVEFLTDNTLGRIWYEMTKGKTTLVDSCQYLVRRPNEVFLEVDQNAPDIETNDDEADKELSQEELLQQTVYIQHRPLKDPRDIKMLDPACGSMHFGLYAFDLFEKIYSEAWDLEETNAPESLVRETVGDEVRQTLHQAYDSKEAFLADVPRLIIEHNIHGVDIDPRAAQIAGLSLWLRAQKSWADNAIQPNKRPQIQRSNIVCAEPMPGEKKLLKEFTSQIKPRVLGQLVEEIFDKMELAGEAGTLLKIEEEIEAAINDAKAQKDEGGQWEQGNLFGEKKWDLREGTRYNFDGGISDDFWDQAEYLILAELERYAESASDEDSSSKRLFAADAAKGFAFIDLCRKRYDVVLMNPPFGDGAKSCAKYFSSNYPAWSKNILCCFIARSQSMSSSNGVYGAIFDRTVVLKSSYQDFREQHLINNISLVADTGWGVLDANVETTSYVFSKNQRGCALSTFVDLLKEPVNTKGSKALQCLGDISKGCVNDPIYLIPNSDFYKLPNSVIGYSFQDFVKAAFLKNETLAELGWQARKGHDYVSFQHFRLFWERDISKSNLNGDPFVRVYNGGKYSSFLSPLRDIAVYGEDASLVKEHKSVYLRNKGFHFKKGIGYGKRGDVIDAHVFPEGFSFTSEGLAITALTEDDSLLLLGYLNSSAAQFILNTYSGQHKQVGYVNLLPFPSLDEDEKKEIINNVKAAITLKKKWLMIDETSPFFNFNLFIEEVLTNPSIDKVFTAAVCDNNEYKAILDQNDKFFCHSLGCTDNREVAIFQESRPEDFPWPEDFKGAKIDELNEIVPRMAISILLGCAFGRWTSAAFESRSLGLFDTLLDFDYKSFQYSSSLLPSNIKVDVLGLDTTDKHNIYSYMEAVIENIWKKNGRDEIERFASQLQCNDFSDLFSPSLLFPFHLEQYSKSRREAPVYWPLQTNSGAYTLWIYFHHINEQTLFVCVNDFVDPKLAIVEEDLLAIRNKASRSGDDEKNLAKLAGVVSELMDFRDELIRISQFYRPDLNDGIRLTAAPLWKLFNHIGWKNKLKNTWGELEQGKYDWSHMAYNIWPERVLKKCHQDRSIAIAHNVESDLWEEVEVPAARGRRTKWVWQPKEMSEAELDAYIQQKIAKGSVVS